MHKIVFYGGQGHTEVTWETEAEAAVKEAGRIFEEALSKGGAAFSTTEEQLRHLIGDAAYFVWEETGRIRIDSKLGYSRAMTFERMVSAVLGLVTSEGEAGSARRAYPYWLIRRPRSPANPVTLWYWYQEEKEPWRIRGIYHCVGAAWGFKGSVPLADQVIALCLWIHADEEAVTCKAFPKVQSLPRAHRAEHWDAIVSGQKPGDA